jgi:hypothetical protein
MDINDITIREWQQLLKLFKSLEEVEDGPHKGSSGGLMAMVGAECIVRTQSAGVWFGVIQAKDGREVIVKNARRLWRWKAAESLSLSAVARYGVDPRRCKFAPAVGSVWLEAIELIPVTPGAAASIKEVPDAKAE